MKQKININGLLKQIPKILFFITFLSYFSCSEAPNSKSTGLIIPITDSAQYFTVFDSNCPNELWDSTVAIHLKEDLWKDIFIYDAGHFLMVPLHAAFEFDKKEWQIDFYNHFQRFSKNKDSISEGRLNKVHYYYLLSDIFLYLIIVLKIVYY